MCRGVGRVGTGHGHEFAILEAVESRLAGSARSDLVRRLALDVDGRVAPLAEPSRQAVAYLGSDLTCAWRGPSLLVATRHSGTVGDAPITGFYFREARHLSAVRFTINGSAPWLCECAELDANQLGFTYIHPELVKFGGGGSGEAGNERSRDESGLPHRALEIQLRYVVLLNRLEIHATITNRWTENLEFELAWQLGADFADFLDASSPKPDVRNDASVVRRGSELRLTRTDIAGYATHIGVDSDSEWHLEGGVVAQRCRLEPQASCSLTLTVRPDDSLGMTDADASERERALAEWQRGLARITTPGNALAERIVARHINDFAAFPLMEGAPDEWLAMQAGVPLYPALFGRDVVTAGWQAAFLDRGTALDAALTRLGRLQGKLDDPQRDEQPGRIVQQVRRGPNTKRGSPFGRYYGDFASPLMYVISLAQLYAWTGDADRIRKHWDVARRILDWAREFGDRDGDGYLEYATQSAVGPTHQGWKDSGDAIVQRDGTPARGPIATSELQGYWYAAQQMMAILSWALGERDDAVAHWDSARELKERFNRDWWLEEESIPALAMDGDKQLVRSPASNAGHCLACGILDEAHLPRTVGRLFASDMFSGWGIRTLSSAHRVYDPLSYHRGSVWAVENATIAFGLRRFGFDERALDIAKGLFDLAALYPDSRIPETVGGYSRIEHATPGAYPRANPAQLWNASGIALLIHVMAGLQPVGPLSLLVVDPVLPSWLPEIVIHDLKFAGATVSLRFWRDKNGASHTETLRKRGTFHLVRQPPIESQRVGWSDRFTALADRVLHH